jgi:hypothetical protein
MSKNVGAAIKILGIGVTTIQLIDIILHAATNQLEIIRVSANLIMILWLAVVMSGKSNTKSVALSSIGAYLLLNFIFLAREGLTNVEQGGGLRVALFLLMFLTVIPSTILASLTSRK